MLNIAIGLLNLALLEDAFHRYGGVNNVRIEDKNVRIARYIRCLHSCIP